LPAQVTLSMWFPRMGLDHIQVASPPMSLVAVPWAIVVPPSLTIKVREAPTMGLGGPMFDSEMVAKMVKGCPA